MVKILSAAVMLALATGAAAPRALHGQSERTVPIQPIDPSWLQADTVTKTATFELVAGLTGLNGALNFNGGRDVDSPRGFGINSAAVSGGQPRRKDVIDSLARRCAPLSFRSHQDAARRA